MVKKIYDVDIFNVENSEAIEVDSDTLVARPNYMIFTPMNTFYEEGVFVASLNETSPNRDKIYIRNAIWNLHNKIGTKHELRTLIIAGSHGSEKGGDALADSNCLEKRKGPHGLNLFYEYMCGLAGVTPSPDLPSVDSVFKTDVSKHSGLLKPEHEKVRIEVLNIEHFTKKYHHRCRGETCLHSYAERGDELQRYISYLRPQLVIIDWCWGRNGEVATSLNTFITQLSLSLDRTFIAGYQGWVEADPEQKNFIDEVDNRLRSFKWNETNKSLEHNWEPIILYGPNGTGKTLLGAMSLRMLTTKLRSLGLSKKLKIYILELSNDSELYTACKIYSDKHEVDPLLLQCSAFHRPHRSRR